MAERIYLINDRAEMYLGTLDKFNQDAFIPLPFSAVGIQGYIIRMKSLILAQDER